MHVRFNKFTVCIAVVVFVAWSGPAMGGGFQSHGAGSVEDGSVPRDFIGYWSFDEIGGGLAFDSALFGNHGTVHGATRSQGVLGNALSFGGRSDYVEISSDRGFPVNLGDLTEGTISVWFKIDTVPDVNTVYPVFYMGSRDGKFSVIIEIGHFSSNSALFFTVYENGFPPQCFDSGSELQTHTWYHFAAVVGADFNTGYLNGEEMVERDYNFGTAASHFFFKDVKEKDVVWIGRGFFGNLPQDQYLDGAVDEVQLFDRPLDALEIEGIYASVVDASAGGCILDPSVWPDVDGDGIPDACCTASSPEFSVGAVAMNRYLTFRSPTDETHAIRVTAVEMPDEFNHLVGQTLWVGSVAQVSEMSGISGPRYRTFQAASLQCRPFYANWRALGSIYVYDEMIIPGATYRVQALKGGCGRTTEQNFSEALTLRTASWGDLTGLFADSRWTGPDGRVDVIGDVVAAVEKFRNSPGSPIKARVDLYPAIPDRMITILDVVMATDAYRGEAYPFMPSASRCAE